jgi:hippurate hydrolase
LISLVLSEGLTSRGDQPSETAAWIDKQLPSLLETYHWLHLHPEVSFQEKETAAFISQIWRDDGYEVTTDVGGHGVVGVLKNGAGPTLMLRCDLDALPVTEQTQLPFASTQKIELPGGATAGVMHACGHDVHMTNLVATAQYMAQHQSEWSGTLMLIAQPAEERGAGARAMLADGLFDRFPKPDYAVALHVSGDKRSGAVGVRSGYALANVDSVDIRVKGRGGHGSQPHTAIDPIVQAAYLVISLQTIVSREVKPIDPAVVTVGSIHGGTKHNIIGNECHLQITVRSYTDQVRQQVLSAIRRKAIAVAESFNAPKPEISVSEGTPSLKNDADLTARLKSVFVRTLGEENVAEDEPSMGGEDFSQYGRAGIPILMYRLGSVSQSRLDRFKELGVPPPSLHSSRYYPDIEPTLRTGVLTMTAAALDLLSK